MDKVRSTLIQSKLLRSLWAETYNTAYYLVNLNPSTTIGCKILFKMWNGKPTSYKDLKVFGCQTYAHISQKKLALKALKRVFIGYPNIVKGYRIWCLYLSLPKCTISRGMVFNEEKIVNKSQASEDKQVVSTDDVKFEVEPHAQSNSDDAADLYEAAEDSYKQYTFQQPT